MFQRNSTRCVCLIWQNIGCEQNRTLCSHTSLKGYSTPKLKFCHYSLTACCSNSIKAKIQIEPLMADGVSWRCFSYFSEPRQCYLLGSQRNRHKPPGFYLKYLKLCSEDEQSYYGVGTTCQSVKNDKIFIFGWSNPLKYVIWP